MRVPITPGGMAPPAAPRVADVQAKVAAVQQQAQANRAARQAARAERQAARQAGGAVNLKPNWSAYGR